MTASPRLGFTYLTSGQAAPETAVNEIGAYLESAAGHFIFKDRDLATPPGSPANGDCYLVAASPTGAWTGKAGKIAYYLNTAWIFVTVIEGYTAWINDENVFVGYDGAAWSTLAVASAGTFLQSANNLSDVANAGTSRTNLGLGSAALLASSAVCQTANNLSDVANAGTSRTNLGVGTGDSPQFTALNIGHATDTTVTRTGAGDIAVEGNAIYRAGGTDVPVVDGGTGSSTAAGARTNLGLLRLIAFFFTTTPTASEVLCIYVAADDFTLAANLSGSQVSVGTNPTATFAIDVQKNGSTIATISISTLGVATLTTSGGTSKAIVAGDILKFVAPGSADATAANIAVNLKGTL